MLRVKPVFLSAVAWRFRNHLFIWLSVPKCVIVGLSVLLIRHSVGLDVMRKHVLSIHDPSNSWLDVMVTVGSPSWFPEVSGERRIGQPSSGCLHFLDPFPPSLQSLSVFGIVRVEFLGFSDEFGVHLFLLVSRSALGYFLLFLHGHVLFGHLHFPLRLLLLVVHLGALGVRFEALVGVLIELLEQVALVPYVLDLVLVAVGGLDLRIAERGLAVVGLD